jgi:segregation and condensation protein A
MSFAVRTQAYSGPFDLLLQLVSRQKVAIGSISVAEVADQYLAEVDRMGELDLDVASDFLLVASTLLDMKAASLVPDDLPRRTDEGEEDDLADLSPDEAREVLIDRPRRCRSYGGGGAHGTAHRWPRPGVSGPHA